MRLSLRARLRLGFAILTATLMVLAVAAVLSLNRLGNAIATILKENYASVLAAEQMMESLERQDSGALFAASAREDIGRPLIEKHRASFVAALARERANITLPGEGDVATQLAREYDDYVTASDRLLASLPPTRLEQYFKNLLPRSQSIKRLIERIHTMNQANMEASDRAAKQLAARSVTTAVFIALIALVFSAFFTWWLPRSLVKPVDDLAKAAREIGEGNLDTPVPVVETGELEPLAVAFARMLEKLRAYRASSLGELLAAKDLANSTVSCMLDPVVVFGREREVLLANDAAQAKFSLQPGTESELRSLEVVIPEAIDAARDTVLANGDPVLPQTLAEAMRWGSGENEEYFLVRAAPLRAEGQTTGVVVLAQDVTRYRRIDELKSDVVATVSHQFKTPLTSLQMITHLLLEPTLGPLTEGQRDLLVTARDETERLRVMVDELLDVVRIEAEAGAFQRRPIDPSALLGSVAEAHRAVAREKGVQLDVVTPASPLSVQGDPERLSIVLSNLVANAIRHTASGGRVTLSATGEGGDCRLLVRDTGEGIPESERARIFERAVSLGADGRDRHGLGLAIAREIALHHGGDIEVESEVGKGSVFAVRLPAKP